MGVARWLLGYGHLMLFQKTRVHLWGPEENSMSLFFPALQTLDGGQVSRLLLLVSLPAVPSHWSLVVIFHLNHTLWDFLCSTNFFFILLWASRTPEVSWFFSWSTLPASFGGSSSHSMPWCYSGLPCFLYDKYSPTNVSCSVAWCTSWQFVTLESLHCPTDPSFDVQTHPLAFLLDIQGSQWHFRGAVSILHF